MAEYGWSMLALFAISIIVFLVPISMVAAELGTAWSREGGVFAWVKEAFGGRSGFLAVWCDYSENVAWFPTVLSFMAAALAYAIRPSLASNSTYLVIVMLGVLLADDPDQSARRARVIHGRRRSARSRARSCRRFSSWGSGSPISSAATTPRSISPPTRSRRTCICPTWPSSAASSCCSPGWRWPASMPGTPATRAVTCRGRSRWPWSSS